MDKRVAGVHEAFGECLEPCLRLRGDPVAGPLDGRPGVRVEPFDLRTADGRGVVVAPDAGRADLAKPCDDAVRVRPIADHIPELPDGVDRAEMGEHGIEGDQVAVDVREDRDPHPREG